MPGTDSAEPSSSRSKKNVKFESPTSRDSSLVESPERGGSMGQNMADDLPPFSLSREDVQSAFEFFDIDDTGVLNMATLKARLSAFYPDLTSKEYRFLLEDQVSMSSTGAPSPVLNGSSNTLTSDQLWELIDTFQKLYMGVGQEEKNAHSPQGGAFSPTADLKSPHASTASLLQSAQVFDPVQEAFRVYDPHGTNSVDVSVLGHIMARIGFGELSSDELGLLVQTADFDGDGEISLEDFRRLVSMKGRFRKKKK